MELTQQIINGLSLGAVYALIAVGYTMVYGTLRLINFAHGDVFMVGAMAGLYAFIHMGLRQGWSGLIVAVLVSMGVCAILGFLIEQLAYRPLRNRPRMTALITAIGVSMLLEYGGQHPLVFGASPRAYPEMMPQAAALKLSGVIVDRVDMLIFAATVVLMVGLSLIVRKTRTGMALRAVSFRFDTATLMGINTNRIISFTFVLGSALAAVGGVLWGIKYRQVDPLMGLMPGLKAFVAAVLGGIGSIAGAVLGGFVIGLVEVMVIAYLPSGSQYKNGVAFVILIVILLVKPSGLLGRNVVEKV